jgi:hypothetical protein
MTVVNGDNAMSTLAAAPGKLFEARHVQAVELGSSVQPQMNIVAMSRIHGPEMRSWKFR